MSPSPAASPVDQADPLLIESLDRFVLHPVQHQDMWVLYKKAVASFWTVEEVDLADDAKHWLQLTEEERRFVETVLAFFAASDGIVSENLAVRTLREVQCPEARAFYSFQIAIEGVHAEMYSLLLQTYVKDPARKSDLFRAVERDEAIGRKARWAMRWTASERSFAERLIAFACVEGIHFSGSFCAIFWLKKRGLMPGLCFSNELISRDEGLHRDFAVLLHNTLQPQNRASPETVAAIVREAVEIEHHFVRSALPVSLLGMNADQMCTYIEFVSDHLMVALGMAKLYNAQNPFDWMETISLQGKTK